jgi:hypothetical protein
VFCMDSRHGFGCGFMNHGSSPLHCSLIAL